MITLVSFLGNPGREYDASRHNLPWLLSDRITADLRVAWQTKFKGMYAIAKIGDSKIYLHKPLTYMNLSGKSVREIMAYFKIEAENLLVIHDDVEMEPGEIGLKFGGGLGGHKGLRSIVAILGTKDFYRLRVGVGRPKKGDVSSHVLRKLTSKEIDDFSPVLDAAADLVEKLIKTDEPPQELIKRYTRYQV
jgi:peptidyl-tRNA hydrolase, PTH1 family